MRCFTVRRRFSLTVWCKLTHALWATKSNWHFRTMWKSPTRRNIWFVVFSPRQTRGWGATVRRRFVLILSLITRIGRSILLEIVRFALLHGWIPRNKQIIFYLTKRKAIFYLLQYFYGFYLCIFNLFWTWKSWNLRKWIAALCRKLLCIALHINRDLTQPSWWITTKYRLVMNLFVINGEF